MAAMDYITSAHTERAGDLSFHSGAKHLCSVVPAAFVGLQKLFELPCVAKCFRNHGRKREAVVVMCCHFG